MLARSGAWDRYRLHRDVQSRFCQRFGSGGLAAVRARLLTVAAKAAAEEREELKVGKSTQRLSKVLAKMGVASRRKAEEIIAEGRVTVNGEAVTIPQTVVRFKSDKIEVDGKRMKSAPPEQYYFAVNKPSGYVCTSVKTESHPKRVVLDLFDRWLEKWKRKNAEKAVPPRLFTVGRLDKESRGLILVTNDGQWAQQVAHPSSGLTKEYVVHTEPEAKMRHIRLIAQGYEDNGTVVEPIGVAKEDDFLRIVTIEGRHREVRMLVENAGLRVTSLKRVRIGGYRLPSNLNVGEFRILQPHERRRLTDSEGRIPKASSTKGKKRR